MRCDMPFTATIYILNLQEWDTDKHTYQSIVELHIPELEHR